MDYNKLWFVAQYFHSNPHNFHQNAKFTISEKTENKTRIPAMMKNPEDRQIKRLQTLTPNGFNIKLNNPQNTALKLDWQICVNT